MSYNAGEIAAHLETQEAATAAAAVRASAAIASAWNRREFYLSATLGPLQRCVLESPGMAGAADVLDRLTRRFDTHVHPTTAWEPGHPAAGRASPANPAPNPTGADRQCRRCQASYVNDGTPMGNAGHCMLCRPHVEVTCDRCATTCQGAFDGQQKCTECRATPLGVQQYEDKQAAAIVAQQRPARILITGSRTWTDTTVIREALAAIWHPDTVLVTGACPRGVDRLAEECWTHWGGRVERHPADWDRYGRRVGYVRNHHMIETQPDLCLAFIRGRSRGASHCAGWADAAGIPVRVYTAP